MHWPRDSRRFHADLADGPGEATFAPACARSPRGDAAYERLRGRTADVEQRDAAAGGGGSQTVIRKVSASLRRARRVAVAQLRGKMAGPTGFEPATSVLTVQCANQAAPRARARNQRVSVRECTTSH